MMAYKCIMLFTEKGLPAEIKSKLISSSSIVDHIFCLLILGEARPKKSHPFEDGFYQKLF
jgi:hypothetical protein